MSRHDVTVQTISRAGITPTYEAVHADLQHAFVNDGRTFLQVKNVNAATRTATLKIASTVDGQAVTAPVVTIPATTGDKLIGPFPKSVYNQADGKVHIDFSVAADVTLAAIKLPAADT